MHSKNVLVLAAASGARRESRALAAGMQRVRTCRKTALIPHPRASAAQCVRRLAKLRRDSAPGPRAVGQFHNGASRRRAAPRSQFHGRAALVQPYRFAIAAQAAL